MPIGGARGNTLAAGRGNWWGSTGSTMTASQGDSSLEQEQVAEPPSRVVWRLRVCPIMFEDFTKLRSDFGSILTLSSYVEFRMSQNLSTAAPSKHWVRSPEETYLSWLPNEKVYIKAQNAATAGMMELKVNDNYLQDLMTLLRTTELSKRHRLRFELKRLTGKPSLSPGDREERDVTPDEDFDLQINFAVRLKPVKMPAFQHPPGHHETREDRQVFLMKVPPEIPDYILKTIMMVDPLPRQNDDPGCVAFNVTSALGAQGYMELFDGLLINNKEVEMATTLGTLQDAKKKHSEHQEERRESNEMQIREEMKRKPDGYPVGLMGPPGIKRPREDFPAYPPPPHSYPPGGVLGGPGLPRGRGGIPGGPGLPRGGRGGIQGGPGFPRGAMGGLGLPRGARGGPGLARGGVPQRGRGIQQQPMPGAGRGVMRGGSRGAAGRPSITRGGLPGRGGAGEAPGRGRGVPPSLGSGGAMGGAPGTGALGDIKKRLDSTQKELLQAKLKQKQREMELIQQQLEQE